jgi:hypothetical protein
MLVDVAAAAQQATEHQHQHQYYGNDASSTAASRTLQTDPIMASFMREMKTNEVMRQECLSAENIVNLVVVANRFGFAITPPSFARYQAELIAKSSDDKLGRICSDPQWLSLCFDFHKF